MKLLILALLACSRTLVVDALASRLPCPPMRIPNSLVKPTTSSSVRSVRVCPHIHQSLSMADSIGEDDGLKDANDSLDELIPAEGPPEELSRLQKIRQRLFPPQKQGDGLTFRQKLAKLGLSVALSYGWVSNVSYSVTVSLAWYIFSKRTGLSPLAPGQWKGFLAVYAGFYVFNNIVRPIRLALSVSVSIYFERVVAFFQETFKVNKGVAVGLTVFFANVVGTITLMCLGISIAATAAGVPVFAK